MRSINDHKKLRPKTPTLVDLKNTTENLSNNMRQLWLISVEVPNDFRQKIKYKLYDEQQSLLDHMHINDL